jgi:hypothetical protein
MRLGAMTIFVSFLILVGCGRADSDRRDEKHSAGESAGKAAYDVQKGAKKAAKELNDDLKNFRHDAQQGYKEEQARDRARREQEQKKPDQHP